MFKLCLKVRNYSNHNYSASIDCEATRDDENNRVIITCGSSDPVYIEDGLIGDKGDQGEKVDQSED